MSTPTPLGRHARGLPRYYLDVGWHRHPTFAGLGVDALALFPILVGYCTEHGTDGAMPADLEDLAAGLGVRLSIVNAGVPELLERAVLEHQAEHLVLAGWADHNPTRVEVEEHARERSRSGSLGNHRRWHEARGITAPDCPHCTGSADRSPIATDRSPASSESLPTPERSSLTPEITPSDRSGIATAIATGSHGMGWDGMGSDDDDASDRTSTTTEAHALDHLEAHIAYRGALIRNPAGFRVSTRHDVLTAAAQGLDLEELWPTAPSSATPPTPDHIAGTGHLGQHHHDDTSELIDTDARGAAVVDLDALRARSSA